MKIQGWLALALVISMAGLVVEEVRIARLREQLAESGKPVAAGSGAERDGEGARATVPGGGMRDGRTVERAERTSRGDAEAGGEGEAVEAPAASLRKMIENPAGRAMMNQGVRAMAGVWYAGLMKDFGLNEEERECFLDLVAAGFGKQQELGVKIMSAKDEAERTAITEEIKAATQAQNDAIKTFLNDEEDHRKFLAYQDRLSEYQQMDGVRAAMKQANVALRPEQEAPLVEAMFLARTSVPASGQWQGGTGGMEAIARGEARQEFERYWESVAGRSLEEAGKVLDAAQIDAFRGYLDQVKQMQLLSLKMAEQMLHKEQGK